MRATPTTLTTRRRELTALEIAYRNADAEPQVSDDEALRTIAKIAAEQEKARRTPNLSVTEKAMALQDDEEMVRRAFRSTGDEEVWLARSWSADGHWYTMTIDLSTTACTATCSCPAGSHGRPCKHRELAERTIWSIAPAVVMARADARYRAQGMEFRTPQDDAPLRKWEELLSAYRPATKREVA